MLKSKEEERIKEKSKEKSTAVAVARAVASRRQNGRKRTVFVQAEQKRDQDGQTATVKDVGAEHTVFRAKYEQSNENPKGSVTTR